MSYWNLSLLKSYNLMKNLYKFNIYFKENRTHEQLLLFLVSRASKKDHRRHRITKKVLFESEIYFLLHIRRSMF